MYSMMSHCTLMKEIDILQKDIHTLFQEFQKHGFLSSFCKSREELYYLKIARLKALIKFAKMQKAIVYKEHILGYQNHRQPCTNTVPTAIERSTANSSQVRTTYTYQAFNAHSGEEYTATTSQAYMHYSADANLNHVNLKRKASIDQSDAKRTRYDDDAVEQNKQFARLHADYKNDKLALSQADYTNGKLAPNQAAYTNGKLGPSQAPHNTKKISVSQPEYTNGKLAPSQAVYNTEKPAASQPDYSTEKPVVCESDYSTEKPAVSEPDYSTEKPAASQPDYRTEKRAVSHPDYKNDKITPSSPPNNADKFGASQEDYTNEKLELSKAGCQTDELAVTQADFRNDNPEASSPTDNTDNLVSRQAAHQSIEQALSQIPYKLYKLSLIEPPYEIGRRAASLGYDTDKLAVNQTVDIPDNLSVNQADYSKDKCLTDQPANNQKTKYLDIELILNRLHSAGSKNIVTDTSKCNNITGLVTKPKNQALLNKPDALQTKQAKPKRVPEAVSISIETDQSNNGNIENKKVENTNLKYRELDMINDNEKIENIITVSDSIEPPKLHVASKNLDIERVLSKLNEQIDKTRLENIASKGNIWIENVLNKLHPPDISKEANVFSDQDKENFNESHYQSCIEDNKNDNDCDRSDCVEETNDNCQERDESKNSPETDLFSVVKDHKINTSIEQEVDCEYYDCNDQETDEHRITSSRDKSNKAELKSILTNGCAIA